MARTLAVARRPEPESPTCYTWSFPGSPVQVRLALDVVERLQKELGEADGSSGKQGLLLGRAVGQTAEIDDFRTLPGSEPLSISKVAASIPPSDTAGLIGYYRIRRDVLRLNDDDINLARAVFPDPHQVFLLIQPTDSGPATATFFFWDEGRMCGDFSFLEFPFDASLLAIAERQKIQTTQTKSLTKHRPADSALPDNSQPPRPRRIGRVVFWSVLAALLVTGALIADVATRVFPGRFRPLHTPPPGLSSTVANALPIQIPLGLQAERQNHGDLKLTWNRGSGAVLSATSGVLSIEDGGGKRELALDSAQVRNGSILYAPTTDQIQMQLTVVDPQHTATSESVIVLLPKTGAPRVQALERKEVLSTPIAAKPESTQQQPAKPFSPPLGEEPTFPPAPMPVNEPPALHVSADLPVSIPVQLAPPSPSPAQPAPAQPQPSPQTLPPQTLPPQTPTPRPLDSTSEQQQPTAPVLLPVYYPPTIISLATPIYPAALKGMSSKSKTVEVTVSIDETGRVARAESLPPKEWVHQLMIQASVEAARRCKFKPARKGTQPISSQMVLTFAFKSPQ